MSQEKKTTFTRHFTGCLVGILIIVYYNPNLSVVYNPLYTLNNKGFFIAHISPEMEPLQE